MSTLLSAGQLPPNRHDDLDNYNVDDFDDPFASPSPPTSAKKRKEPPASSGLGIDEEVSVQKRAARAPNVKLDEERLLGSGGLPKLRQRARDLKIKGKGHEFSDAARLLSFYQIWLDDLFPKAKFLDALAMVEKAGHKKRIIAARNEYIDEGKPKDTVEDGDDDFGLDNGAENTTSGENGQRDVDHRPQTPARNDDIPDDMDLYDATPKQSRATHRNDAEPDDEDDLDALIAEAEGQDTTITNGNKRKQSQHGPDGEEDDLDALIAEAETQDEHNDAYAQKQREKDQTKEDFAEEEAAMQEMDGLW